MLMFKISCSIYFIVLNFLIFQNINFNKRLNKKYFLSLLMSALILIFSNFYFSFVSQGMFAFLILFSLAIFIMNFLSSFLKVFQNSSLIENDKLLIFKKIIFRFIIPIFITIFQIITIWFDKTFN